MILLAGRIAEEEFFDVSVTTGAINDFEEALKLAEKMIVYYGMGSNPIYPHQSEKYKEVIDNEVTNLIKSAYTASKHIISLCHDLIYESSEILKNKKILNVDELISLIKNKYPKIYNDLL
jgi:ATP-dependent Zn protease